MNPEGQGDLDEVQREHDDQDGQSSKVDQGVE